MEPGTLHKVFNDFLTTVEGELSLSKGDYFLVLSVENKHWAYGQCHDRWGNFPTSHLHQVEIPQIDANQNLFISISHNVRKEPGQLSFRKGELIIGIKPIDEKSFYGKIDGQTGIFPLSCTWKLDTSKLKISSKKVVCKRACVKVSLEAQLDEELSLRVGDILTVEEIGEDGWCRGTTTDGRSGTFPEGFIEYIEDPENDEVDESSAKYPEYTMNRDSYESKDKSFKATNACKETFKDEGNNASTSYMDEPAPDYYELFPHMKEPTTSEDKGDDCGIPNPLGTQPYAISLYRFTAQYPNELSFKTGELVILKNYIDKDWMEGSVDGRSGIFPVSHVKIVVDCEQVTEDESGQNNEPVCEAVPETNLTLEPGTKLRVEYTYAATSDGDLSVDEGEIVSVVGMVNDHWVTVVNVKGETGVCPRTYLSAEPQENRDFEENLKEFVMLRHNSKKELKDVKEDKSKRLSEPHRPAPPTPAPDHRSSLSKGVSEKKEKNATQRQNVISELVITEKDYVNDLKLTYETFDLHDPSVLENQGIDVKTLFGNLGKVMLVAEDLLDKILRAMKGCDENHQTVGPCFIEFSDDLLKVYKKYCGNHAAALELLKKYDENPKIKAIFTTKTAKLKTKINCFDMSSILIKPVQRILKYPLLLRELIECTENDHPDKQKLIEAFAAMTSVASNINEFKRRKDVIDKVHYNENTLSRRIANVNIHSVKKKTTRIGGKVSASLGVISVDVNPQFDEYEKQFKLVQKCAKDLSKDVSESINHLLEKTKCARELADFLASFCDGTPCNEVANLVQIRRDIDVIYIPKMVKHTQELISQPLDNLMKAMEGSNKLIDKRMDKAIDYVCAEAKVDKHKSQELSLAKNDFEAIDQQLLEELPIFIEASTKILIECVRALTTLRKFVSGKILARFLKAVESTQNSSQDIPNHFLSDYAFSSNQGQSEQIRQALKVKYAGNLYKLKQNYTITLPVITTFFKDTLVGVMKKHDPMGNESNWFVDDGKQWTLIPSEYLEPVQVFPEKAKEVLATPSETRNVDAEEVSGIQIRRSSFHKSNKEAIYENSRYSSVNNMDYDTYDRRYNNLSHHPDVVEFYHAKHEFNSNLPGTLSVEKGQALKLVTPHDLKGNDEWWLMQNRKEEKGYVPKNYLEPFQN